MGHDSNGGRITSHEERVRQHLHILYTQQLEENQIFMHELKEYRRKKDKAMLQSIKEAVGPAWYQALSVPQRNALDNLESSIYKDLLEGRPTRTSKIMRVLGLYPRPSRDDLMVCIERGRDDPKEMIAQLYYLTFGYPIEGKRMSYILNAKLMLSAIFYLGLANLIQLLRERFRPDEVIEEPPPRSKAKPEPPLASPYLQKMVAVLYEKPIQKRAPPPPLPNLDELDDPYEEEPLMPKPPPPPPPPPPPKKRIPISVCDAMAGIYPLNLKPLEPVKMENIGPRKSLRPGLRKSRSSKASLDTKGKKVYGLNLGFRKKNVRRKKPVAPSTGLENAQYTICGVYEINGKAKFVLGNVSLLPAQGDFIHGGYVYIANMCIPLHCGYRGRPPAPKLPACDCQKKWNEAVFKYVKGTKCQCGHHFDYCNEGKFPSDELPYFIKPSRHSPLHFNYQTIYDLDEKHLHVEKEFKKAWETDSFLRVDDGTLVAKDDKKKKKKKTTSDTCLGANPKPEDYLKCALRFMRRANIAARLPDLHLVPELISWMRRRLYGPLSQEDKAELLRKSTTYWRFFSTLAVKGFGHIAPPKDSQYEGHTNWLYKKKLYENFRRYYHKYRLSVYRSHAYVTNLLWRSMYQAEQPDKKFREIFFSYLFDKLEDLQLLKPYSSKETQERKIVMAKRRYICLPEGIDAVNF